MRAKNDWQTLKRLLAEGFTRSDDVVHRVMESGDDPVELLYVKSICDTQMLTSQIISPYWEFRETQEYQTFLRSFPNCTEAHDLPSTLDEILAGSVAIFFQDALYLFEVRHAQATPINEATVETTVQGPQDAFNEDLMTSLNLIRYRYQTSSLRVEMHIAGKLSKTKIALVYDESLVDSSVLEKLKERMKSIEADLIQSTGQLQRHISQDPWNVFPTAVATERPDRAVLNISKGKVIIVVDKTPFVLIVPSVFSDFFSAMDDAVQLPVIGHFLRGLRYIGLVLTLTLPGLYVGTISYNPEFFRIQLAFSVAASRAAVPYASYLEVIFMLLMIEFLTESSIRLPKVIGPTATTVGGLILGQAASQAGLVSNIMIIIIATVAISNFVIPISAMSFAIRVVKYPLLVLATFFGLPGVIIGLIGFVFYLANLDSFGVPYVKMFREGDKT